MDKKSRVQELMESVSKIDNWLDPLTKDKSRLTLIKELMLLWDVSNARRIIQGLYLEKSIEFAESMISWNKNNLVIENSHYLQYSKIKTNKRIMPKLFKKQNIKTQWDAFLFDNLIKYIEDNTNSMTSQKKSYVTRNIGRMKDESMKIKLEKLLWKWDWVLIKQNFFKNSKKSITKWNNLQNIFNGNLEWKAQESVANFSDFVRNNKWKSFFKKLKTKKQKKKSK
jgi:hypothetical protein